MENENKKLNLKIIIPVAIVIVVIAVIGIVIIKSNTLTKEEQYAVNYLLCNSALKPNTTEIHRVWIYEEDNKWYFAYDITVKSGMFGDNEIIYGNETGITLKELAELKVTELEYKNYNAPAKEKGKKLNTNKIQKAFQEQY